MASPGRGRVSSTDLDRDTLFSLKEPVLSEAADIVAAINDGYGPRDQKPRRYIGASGIGNKCEAALAFALRGFPDDSPDPQLQRIFNLGNVVEDIVVRDLTKRAKLDVMENDPLTGKQWHYDYMNGHIRCNLDGLIELPSGRLRNLEIKSMNDASWTKFMDRGVRFSHPHYFDQMQMQMAMSRTADTLFIAYNKNNSKYHAEIVEFDEIEWAFLKTRIESALLNTARRIAGDESDWRCRGCFKRTSCWGSPVLERECYHCQHASAEPDGGWHCHLHNMPATATCGSFERYRPLAKE